MQGELTPMNGEQYDLNENLVTTNQPDQQINQPNAIKAPFSNQIKPNFTFAFGHCPPCIIITLSIIILLINIISAFAIEKNLFAVLTEITPGILFCVLLCNL